MEQNQSILKQWSSNDLFNVAKWQKYIILLVLLQLMTAAGFVIMSMMSSGVQPGAPVNTVFGAIAIIYQIFRIVVAVLSIYCVFKIGKALGKSMAILYAVGMILPLIGLLLLLTLNNEATHMLQSNNVKVGLMGADKDDLERLRTEANQ